MPGYHLGYHFIREGGAPGPVATPSRLRQHLSYFRDLGHEFLICGEVGRRLAGGFPLPKDYVSLSFDDGLADHVNTVMPILEEFGACATFFIISCALRHEMPPVTALQVATAILGPERLTEILARDILADTDYARILDPAFPLPPEVKQGERPELRRLYWVVAHLLPMPKMREAMRIIFADYVGTSEAREIFGEWCLGPADVLELHRRGHEIGSHTATHPILQHAALAEVEGEFRTAREELSDLIGIPVRTFAWTYGGDYRDELQFLALRYYESAWNFRSRLSAMPAPPYRRSDIPRLNEAVWDPGTEIPTA